MNKTVVGGKKTGSHWKLLLTNRYCLYIVIRNERTTFLRPHHNNNNIFNGNPMHRSPNRSATLLRLNE